MRASGALALGLALLTAAPVQAQADRQAIEQMEEKFIRKHDNFVKMAALLAALYEEKGDLESAAQLYEKLLALNPEDARIREKLGKVYGRQGRTDALLEMYTRLRGTQPDDREVMVGLAKSLFEADRKEEALALITEALEGAGNDTGTVLEIVRMLTDREQPEQAAAVVEKGLADRPDDPSLLYTLALVRLRMRDYAAAAQAAQMLAENGPLGAHRDRGALLLARALREGKRGKEYFDKNDRTIASLEAVHAKALLELAGARRATGEEEEAVATWRRVLELYPDSPAAGEANDLLKGQ